jgi:agarase
MEDSTPGKQKAAAFLKERGHDPNSLNQEDEAAFLEVIAREYGSLCREAILRYDPNHLVLGCRFAGYAPESVVRGVGPFFDVISYNNYDHQAPIAKLQRIIALCGKPVMVTEFSFKAKDSGLPNTRGGGIPVATQQDRARLFEAYVTELLTLPEFVGFHWFEYADEPKEGRFDGEDCNYGLVRIDGTPWETLTLKMKEVNGSSELQASKH